MQFGDWLRNSRRTQSGIARPSKPEFHCLYPNCHYRPFETCNVPYFHAREWRLSPPRLFTVPELPTRLGPAFLRRPEVADLVVATLLQGLDSGLYDLRAFVVISNHVHLLFRPQRPVSRVLQWLKGTTAREANQVLARTGMPFWQRESYDHWVRDGRELERIAAYVEDNPVKAA